MKFLKYKSIKYKIEFLWRKKKHKLLKGRIQAIQNKMQIQKVIQSDQNKHLKP